MDTTEIEFTTLESPSSTSFPPLIPLPQEPFLNLEYIHLNDQDFAAIERYSQLPFSSLSLKGVMLGENGFTQLQTVLKGSSLAYLDLSYTFITIFELPIVVEIIKNLPFLQILNLSHNYTGVEGMSHFYRLFSMCGKRLTTIDLRHNYLEAEEIHTLSGLYWDLKRKKVTPITHLYLW